MNSKELHWFLAGLLMNVVIVFGGGFLYVISTEQGYQTTRCIILSSDRGVSWEWCIWAMSDLENPENINYSDDNVDF